ncbi:zinc finger and SCAN domain-containing protein 12-like [Micropterus dolomieu]|uniref:zinc finger and SCAN domain-containing protein 12-like n=1 Tax=Micropterus dolomieu TaxID=147949 RepID=UPI001E8C9D75|nr:zinc finger and SCAN domain-containing protein 12-like [Micropterus dolomieu]
MSRLQSLRVFIYQRLTAAVEEIIVHLEKTITESEEEMESRHRKLLDTVSNPEEKLLTAVVSAEVQQQLVIKEEVPSEQQEWSNSLEQEDPEHLHIKEEKQDFCNSQEVRSPLQGLHEEDIPNFPFTHVPVKSEDDEEKPISSQLHQKQTEENSEAELPASCSTEPMKTEADGEDCGGSEPDKNLVSGFKCLSGSDDNTSNSSEAMTEDSGCDWKESRKPQTDLSTMKNRVPVNDMGRNTGNKLFSCSKCGRRFGQKHHLQAHMRCHTGERPFGCSLCGKRFAQKGNLTQHLTVHTREKPCSCPVCGERFAQKGNLTQHMTVHTRENFVGERLTKGF